MKAKPILFNTEMVKKILAGQKTVTRRLIKPRPDYFFNCVMGQPRIIGEEFHARMPDGSEGTFKPLFCVGDILYVRETWQKHHIKRPVRAVPDDFKEIEYSYKADGELANSDGTAFKWRPSIHMPKEAARVFLRVKDVRIERLHMMDSAGCLAEGIESDCPGTVIGVLSSFAELWDSTIKNSDIPLYGFDANPWVWVIEFERVIDAEKLESHSK